MNNRTQDDVTVRVEIFGHARAVTGVRHIQVTLPSESNASDLAVALSNALPSLVSTALDESGANLLTSYTANLNGLTFMDRDPVPVSPGDTIFLFSSQAGG